MNTLAHYQHYADHLQPVARLVAGHDDVTLVAGYGDVVAAWRAGARHIALLQHGIGQSYGSDHPHYPGGARNEHVDLFLVPNHYAGARWAAAYPRARVEVVGSPRLDDLPARQPGDGPTIALAWHWNHYLVPETQSALAWYRGALPQLVATHHVIGTGHPRRTDLQQLYARLGIDYVPDFAEVCRRADLLVFDNTSVGYEFAATGRPVVVLDAPWYRRPIDHGLRFWAAADVGVRISEPVDLLPAIGRALAQLPADVRAREAALAHVYAHRRGAARRAAAAIEAAYAVPGISRTTRAGHERDAGVPG